MVVHELNVGRDSGTPGEDDAEWVIDADTAARAKRPLEVLEAVTWRNSEVRLAVAESSKGGRRALALPEETEVRALTSHEPSVARCIGVLRFARPPWPPSLLHEVEVATVSLRDRPNTRERKKDADCTYNARCGNRPQMRLHRAP